MKDFQQVRVIEDYIKKRNYKTKVIECKIIREKNGLAHSSRNSLLSSKEKYIGSLIYNLILKNKKNIITKSFSLNKLKKIIYQYGAKKIEYIKILDINNFWHLRKKNKSYRIFIAYYLGDTRLIDNI